MSYTMCITHLLDVNLSCSRGVLGEGSQILHLTPDLTIPIMLQLFSTVQLFFVCNYFYNYEGTLRGEGLTMYLTRLTVFKRREIWLEGC